jgi:hypothetical protein
MQNPKALSFDAQAHAYAWRGQQVPGVTRALQPFNAYDFVDQDTLAAAALFGQHVHEAVDLFNRNELDLSSLTVAVAAYLAGWERFLDESGFVVVESEARVYHPKMHYAGTLDAVGQFPRKKDLALVDVKTGSTVPKTVGPQTAAYAEAWQASRRGRKPRRYCVHLGPDSYKLIPLTDVMDFDVFKASLLLHRWQTGE